MSHFSKVDNGTLLLHTSLSWNQFSAIFAISNNVTHEPPFENPSKVPFLLLSYLQEKKGLRIEITFLNNTEVCAF